MAKEWQELTGLTHGAPVVIERVRLVDRDSAIEGEFELPPLARRSAEDQVFIMAFVRFHGSIKEMEQIFGISYPTVKNRLSRLAGKFKFAENLSFSDEEDVLTQLENGEITAVGTHEELMQSSPLYQEIYESQLGSGITAGLDVEVGS